MDINENIYRTNGFRILGLDITSKNRKVDNRISKVDRFMQRNNFSDNEPLKDVFDREKLGFLLPVKPEPSYNEYQDAKNRLKDVETRLIDEIFWFWPKTFDSKMDEEIVEYLKENKYTKAISYWDNSSDGTTLNMTSIHNLAVLYHIRALDGFLEGKGNKKLFTDLELSLKYWSQIVNSNKFRDYVKERVNDINDPRLNEEFVDRIFDDLPHDLLNISFLLIKNILNSGKLSKRKQEYVRKYIHSIQNSPFDKLVISGFSSKITKAIENSISMYKETFDKDYDMSEDTDRRQEFLFDYFDNVFPYLSILNDSFDNDIISEKLINNSCWFIFNKIPNPLILILLKVADEDKFNKFIEIAESLKKFTSDQVLEEKLQAIIDIETLGHGPDKYDVTIKIKDDGGNRLSNADVTLIGRDNIEKYQGKTDSDGEWNISVPYGDYSVEVEKTGYVSTSGGLMVSGESDFTFELKKNAAMCGVVITVKDDGGNRLSNVDLTLTNTGTDKKYYGESDGKGVCKITDLPPARYLYKAEKLGYNSDNGSVNINEDLGFGISLKKQKSNNYSSLTSGDSSYGKKFYLIVGALILISLAYYALTNL